LKQRLDFLFQEKIKTMDRLATIQEQKMVETMVTFSISRKDLDYGYIGYNRRAKNR